MDELINTAPCGYVALADDGTIVDINRTLADLLGYERLELAGWHVDKMLPPGGRIFYHTYLFPLLKVQGSVEEIYVALRTRGGTDVPVLLNGRRREREGRFVSDCICLRMIQRHEYEDQLLHARRLAEEANAAKGRFLSMMSHDLRTPLTTIHGNAQLLADGFHGTLTRPQLEAVEAIREAARMQMTLINDILEYARLDSGNVPVEPEAVPLADVLSRSETLVRVQAQEAGLHFTTQLCDSNVTVWADANRLQQVVLNLLTNAIKFTPPGGSVHLSCESGGDTVRIRVRDTGVGIATGDLQRIFAPFVQVDASAASRGVGLGLAISQELTRAMGGGITVESSPGGGSTFTLELRAGALLDAAGTGHRAVDASRS